MSKKDTFSGYHPLVNMLYFSLVIAFAMVFIHPFCLVISLAAAIAYSIYLKGKKGLYFGLLYMLPMLLIAILINVAFNHQGGTILAYLPSGNPLTLESIAYGIAAAAILVTVIIWFSCFNTVMTSDKFIYLFGKVIPALSLILGMALRFFPRFVSQIKIISQAQKGIGRDISNGNILQKARHGLKILSIMITWTLENAIETADSMKSRGYGLPFRTAFSIYRFERRDAKALAFILAGGIYIIVGAVSGGLYFRYFPTVKGLFFGFYPVSIFIVYLLLFALPLIFNVKEDLKWRTFSTSKT